MTHASPATNGPPGPTLRLLADEPAGPDPVQLLSCLNHARRAQAHLEDAAGDEPPGAGPPTVLGTLNRLAQGELAAAIEGIARYARAAGVDGDAIEALLAPGGVA